MAMTVERWTGREVRALREARRMSLREFGEHLGVSDRMVSKWEAGAARISPRPVNQEALDTSLAKCSDEVQTRFALLLRQVATPTHGLPDDPLVGVGVAALGTDLWELHDALQPRRVSRSSLAVAERACAVLDSRYADLPPTIVLPELRRQLNHVVGWMRDSQPVSYRRRLCALAAHLSGLRGWLCFDMAEHQGADAWLTVALSAAREADDNDLRGWLLGAQSLIPVERQDYATAARDLGEARALAARGGSPTTRAWLSLLEGRALAGLGDHRGFASAHQRATRGLELTSLDERHHGMDFDGENLDGSYYTGLSHLLLRQPQAAGCAFGTGLAHLPDERVRARAMLMLSVAVAAAHDQELDQASALAAAALTVAADQPIRRVWQRAQEVRHAAHPAARSSAVRALDEQLASFAGSMRRATAP